MVEIVKVIALMLPDRPLAVVAETIALMLPDRPLWQRIPVIAFSREDHQTFIVVPSEMNGAPQYTQMPTRDFLEFFSLVFS